MITGPSVPRGVVNYLVIGRNLRAFRLLRNLRQEDMADILGISTTHYSNCERGLRHIDFDYIVNACAALDVSLFDVLSGALDGCAIFSAHDAEEQSNGISLECPEEWLQQILRAQTGCSDKARRYMLEACLSLADLDKSR